MNNVQRSKQMLGIFPDGEKEALEQTLPRNKWTDAQAYAVWLMQKNRKRRQEINALNEIKGDS